MRRRDLFKSLVGLPFLAMCGNKTKPTFPEVGDVVIWDWEHGCVYRVFSHSHSGYYQLHSGQRMIAEDRTMEIYDDLTGERVRWILWHNAQTHELERYVSDDNGRLIVSGSGDIPRITETRRLRFTAQ